MSHDIALFKFDRPIRLFEKFPENYSGPEMEPICLPEASYEEYSKYSKKNSI